MGFSNIVVPVFMLWWPIFFNLIILLYDINVVRRYSKYLDELLITSIGALLLAIPGYIIFYRNSRIPYERYDFRVNYSGQNPKITLTKN